MHLEREKFERQGVIVRSSNYTLYGDMSARVMRVLANFTPDVEIYSIAYSAQAFADLSYAIALTTGINNYKQLAGDVTTASPFVTVSYLYQHDDSFTEQGGAAALAVAGSDNNLLGSTIGTRLHQPVAFLRTSTPRADFDGMMGWKHLTGDVAPSSTARFASGSDSFTTDGAAGAQRVCL